MIFDELEINLESIDQKTIYFIPKNKFFLPSLPKNLIGEFLEGFFPRTKLLIEPKIDGCAIALQYKDGKLEKSINREGIDVTNKIIKVQNIPK